MVDMCYPYGASSVCDMYRKMENYTLGNCAERVDQDVLIIDADDDIYIPTKLLDEELALLRNAKSVKVRIFTVADDQAGNHSNVGDPKAALDAILDWMDDLDKRNGD